MMRALGQPLANRLPEHQLRMLVRLRNGEVALAVSAVSAIRRTRHHPPAGAGYLDTPVNASGACARVVEAFNAHQAADDTARLLQTALEKHRVPFVALPGLRGATLLVAVSAENRTAAMTALAAELTGPEWLVTNRTIGQQRARTAKARNTKHAKKLAHGVAGERIWVYRLLAAAGSDQIVGGRQQSCQLEFWSQVQSDDIPRSDGGTHLVGTRIAPGRNGLVGYLTEENWRAATHAPDHWLPVPHRRSIFEVREPVDLVYTWVNGDDPRWQQRKDSHQGLLDGAEHNSTATHASRFVSRDELRYSLRSVEMFASWVRKIYVVTDQQCPPWLDVSHPKIELIDHKQIFADPDALPVFNSHAIESQLHHIPGLAERYLYLNDDFFFGRAVEPELFFEGNGIARFFLSPNPIDIDPPSSRDLPVMSAAKRNRDVIAADFDVSFSNKLMHTPQPQLRSVLEEMEGRHPELFHRVSHSRFRHPDDVSIPSALHHYYAYALGSAVPGSIRYTYQDIDLPDTQRRLDNLGRRRNSDVFCLNDNESDPDRYAEQSRMLKIFFEHYFPLPSEFELTSE